MEPPPARAGGGAPRLRPPTRAAHSTHARPPTQAVVRCLLAKGRQPLAELLRNSQLERPLLKQVLMALIHQNMVWAWLQPEEVLIDRVVPAVYLYEADLAAILQDLRWGGGERRRSGRAGGRAGGRVGASTSTPPPPPPPGAGAPGRAGGGPPGGPRPHLYPPAHAPRVAVRAGAAGMAARLLPHPQRHAHCMAATDRLLRRPPPRPPAGSPSSWALWTRRCSRGRSPRRPSASPSCCWRMGA